MLDTGSGWFVDSVLLRQPTEQQLTLFFSCAAECWLEVLQTPSLREPMELE